MVKSHLKVVITKTSKFLSFHLFNDNFDPFVAEIYSIKIANFVKPIALLFLVNFEASLKWSKVILKV